MWLGRSSAVALDRAARIADAWICSSHVASAQALEQAARYRERLGTAGRPLPVVRPGLRTIFLARTREDAVARCGPNIDEGGATFLEKHDPGFNWRRTDRRIG